MAQGWKALGILGWIWAFGDVILGLLLMSNQNCTPFSNGSAPPGCGDHRTIGNLSGLWCLYREGGIPCVPMRMARKIDHRGKDRKQPRPQKTWGVMWHNGNRSLHSEIWIWILASLLLPPLTLDRTQPLWLLFPWQHGSNNSVPHRIVMVIKFNDICTHA